MWVEIAAMVIAICFVVLTGFVIPVLREAKRTLEQVDQAATQLNKELPAILEDLRQVADNAKAASSELKESARHANQLLGGVGAVSASLGNMAHGVSHGLGSWMPAVAGVVTGIWTLVKTLRKKKEEA